jgi:creatinine amidohydrolase
VLPPNQVVSRQPSLSLVTAAGGLNEVKLPVPETAPNGGNYVVLSKRSVKQVVWVAVCSMAIAAFASAFLAHAQSASGVSTSNSSTVPKMRTRLLTSLTGYEVADYLKRSDVIFVPVGPTEVNGGNPMDVEYVIPLAYAIKLAEKSDGLVMPYLSYFYPGSTTISPGTVMVTPEEGLTYLKVLTHSLIRQGFRRIIFLSAHGPSSDTLSPLVREIFDETHVPTIWMSTSVIVDGGRARRAAQSAAPAGAPSGFEAAMSQMRMLTYGAYLTVGRLDDMPINFAEPKHEFEADKAVNEVSARLDPGQSAYGRFYADPTEHGGLPRPVTAEQRADWAKQGAALLDSQVAAYDIAGLLDALRKHDQFTKTLEKKYGTLLPPGPQKPE